MSEGIFGARHRALTIGIITLCSLVAFEYIAVATAMPAVAKALDGLELYALSFGGSLAAGVVGMVVAGQWSDRKGPAGPIWWGVGAFVAGLAVAGLAPEMWVVVVGRVVQGFGGGLIGVALYVVVAGAYPAELHPRVFAAFAGAWTIPSMVGPALAGLIVQVAHWRWVFLAVAIVAVPAALLMRSGLRGLPPAADGAAKRSRTALALGAAVSVCVLYIGGQQRGALALGLIALALAGLAVFAPRLLPRRTLRAGRGLPSVVLLRGFVGAAYLQADVFLPLLLQQQRGLSALQSGFALTAGALAWVTGSWWQGRHGKGLTNTQRLAGGSIMIALGVGATLFCVVPVLPVGATVAVAVGGMLVGGLGMGVAYPVMSTVTLELSPPEDRGVNSSALQLSESLFTTTVLALGGSLFALLSATSMPLAFLAVFAIGELLAVLAIAVAFRTRPAAPSPSRAAEPPVPVAA
ncbi:MFS transporter [Bailinhaonella thermotolerans]|uniref:MFS transporter n=1 Tax=Bailinhaonella thermotolerans TaxID=1070861 RepID=UPI00192A3987|nr:MFS transporter [Bailinhaonella thermotolerans]